MDEALHLVFLETYFKGDYEDLSQAEYKDLVSSAAAIFEQPILYEWE